MAIAKDNGSRPAAATVTEMTVAFTVSGTNRILYVGINGDSGASDLTTGVTYAGVAMTLITSRRKDSDRWQSFWYLLAPATGSNNVVITNSSSSYTDPSFVSLTGVKQQAHEASNTGAVVSGTSLSVSVTTISPNAWVVGYGGCGVNVASFGTNTSELDGATNANFNISISKATDNPQRVAKSVSLQWTSTVNSPFDGTVLSVAPLGRRVFPIWLS